MTLDEKAEWYVMHMAWRKAREEKVLMEVSMETLAFTFQRRLLAQDGINFIKGDVLASIASSAEAELISRMAPIEEEA